MLHRTVQRLARLEVLASHRGSDWRGLSYGENSRRRMPFPTASTSPKQYRLLPPNSALVPGSAPRHTSTVACNATRCTAAARLSCLYSKSAYVSLVSSHDALHAFSFRGKTWGGDDYWRDRRVREIGREERRQPMPSADNGSAAPAEVWLEEEEEERMEWVQRERKARDRRKSKTNFSRSLFLKRWMLWGVHF
jgi:hypothetical protein